MANKLEKQTFPTGHGPNDFRAFGPAATKDGVDGLRGTMICDMGCFKQPNSQNPEGVDSNKFFHGAVVQSKINEKWYVYFEWGRTGASKPQFQFVECSTKEESQSEYVKHLMTKNEKRGEWINHPVFGRKLQAKAGDDCYLVRPQATRSTGLPDAKTIVQNEGGKNITTNLPAIVSKKAVSIDSPTQTLLRDLNVGTIEYTRSSMADAAIPTQLAIDDARNLLIACQHRLKIIGNNIRDQINDQEIMNLTSEMYGRIPKKKQRNALPETWVLSADNITSWNLDLDAFESALYSTNHAVQSVSDPYGGMPITMRHIDRRDPLGEFIYSWFPNCTANRHANMKLMKIKNAWVVERHGEKNGLLAAQNKIVIEGKIRESPLKCPYMSPAHTKVRIDIDSEKEIYEKSHTCILIHGTRTCNCIGLLQKSWVLREQAKNSGVYLTAAAFGNGTYWASDWKKSAQYTSTSGARYCGDGGIQGRGAIMFLADIPLGQPHLAEKSFPYSEPPKGTHCIYAKGGYTKNSSTGRPIENDEWITFGTGRVRMRYLIEFVQ